MQVDATGKAEATKPKRAASAYLLFTNSVRDTVTQENQKANGGKCKLGEVAKAMADLWAKLDDKEKAKFEAQAKEAKEKHAVEMQAYKEVSDPLSVLKEKYADLIPKKPMTSYFLFLQDDAQRAKAEKAVKDAGEEAAHKKVTAKLGEIWKALTEADKAQYNDKAKKAVAEYEEKRKVWEARPEFVEFSKLEKEQKDAAKEEKSKENAQQKEAAKEEKEKAKEAAKEEKAKDKEAAKEVKAQEKADAKAAKASPKKRESASEGESPPAKKAKVAKNAKPQAPVIDADVLKKAQGLSLEAALRNLIARPDVVAKDFSHAKLLDALEKSDGLVNKAKHALLGA